jgi:hypothetical protein
MNHNKRKVSEDIVSEEEYVTSSCQKRKKTCIQNYLSNYLNFNTNEMVAYVFPKQKRKYEDIENQSSEKEMIVSPNNMESVPVSIISQSITPQNDLNQMISRGSQRSLPWSCF